MRISDWSSDVCSSDLVAFGFPQARRREHECQALRARDGDIDAVEREQEFHAARDLLHRRGGNGDQTDGRFMPLKLVHRADADLIEQGERKSVVEGNSVSVRLNLRGATTLKKKQHI